MNLETKLYNEQNSIWPNEGKHILAHYDEETIIVYQAYRPSIGLFAIKNGYFGGDDYSLSRMSWIKPNFLWMMYRSNWGMSEGQEVILGLRISRVFFNQILNEAVSSSFDAETYDSREVWQDAVKQSDVRLQWDPDHAPDGSKLSRRAVQLGLRGEILNSFAKDELLEVINMSEFVASERNNTEKELLHKLRTPLERIYIS